MSGPSDSPLLRLPVELRVYIYDLCVLSGPVTIAARPTTTWDGRDQSSRRIPGFPLQHVPIAETGFSKGILQASSNHGLASGPRERRSFSSELSGSSASSFSESSFNDSFSSVSASSGSGQSSFSSASLRNVTSHAKRGVQRHRLLRQTDLYHNMAALHLTCRQTHLDLMTHCKSPHKDRRTLDLYLSYPGGVCAVIHRHCHLLQQAKTIYVTGMCDLSKVIDPGEDRTALRQRKIREALGGQSRPVREVTLEEEQVEALEMLVEFVHGKDAALAAEKAREEQIPNSSNVGKSTNRNETRATESNSHSSASAAPAHQLLTDTIISPPTSSLHIPRTTTFRPDGTPTLLTIDPPPPSLPKQHLHHRRNPHLPVLTLRIFHPNPPLLGYSHIRTQQDSYSALWSHTLSPAVAALARIYGGAIRLSVARGRKGNGVEVVARENKHGDGRCITCYWPRLEASEGADKWCVPSEWGAGHEDGTDELSVVGDGAAKWRNEL